MKTLISIIMILIGVGCFESHNQELSSLTGKIRILKLEHHFIVLAKFKAGRALIIFWGLGMVALIFYLIWAWKG